jgi:hypothetical protein
MVNKLWPILDAIVAAEESVFVPGRRITYNALRAFECVHAIKKGVGGSEEYCAYKLDLSKAYDHVDWGFLKRLMEKLGFQSKWVQWTMTCVSTIRYSVHFNGRPLCPFTPTHGLRHGDPLSPYLFLLVADCLSTLMKHNEQLGLINSLHVCRHAPSISHLLFSYDSLLFFRANAEQVTVIKTLLLDFEKGTCQLLSLSKCSLLVHEGIETNRVISLRNVLGYLGLPFPYGRLTWDTFQPIQEQLGKRMGTWMEKDMSQAAKEVVIKSVAQALPTYIMSAFKLL